MELYTGIDLHSGNSFPAVVDHEGKRMFKKKSVESTRRPRVTTRYHGVPFSATRPKSFRSTSTIITFSAMSFSLLISPSASALSLSGV